MEDYDNLKVFGELPLNIIEENVDLVAKVDSGNEDTEPEKTSLEPKDSETLNLVLDTVQHDYFPSASIEEKFDFPVSESRGVWFEGKPPVIIDDYVGCRKYFDSGEVDAKDFS